LLLLFPSDELLELLRAEELLEELPGGFQEDELVDELD